MEEAVKRSKQAALDAIETDSAMTGTSFNQDDGMFIEIEGAEKFGHTRGKVKFHLCIYQNEFKLIH